jgi:hypothetical protein
MKNSIIFKTLLILGSIIIAIFITMGYLFFQSDQELINNIRKYNNFDDMISNIERITGATDIKISERAKTPYISLKLANFKRAIRLKGELFSKDNFDKAKESILNNINKVNITQTPKKDIEELKTELTELQKNRIESITKRVQRKREQQSKVSFSLFWKTAIW